MRFFLVFLLCLAPLFFLSGEENGDNLRRSIVETALSLEGTPYRYGGTGTGGFDCSGYVREVYMRHSISLPHSSRAQYRDCTPVAIEDACPGDLVFFDVRGKGISHVGIYLGNRRFIHAATTIGKVCISSLDDSSWKGRFYGAGSCLVSLDSGNGKKNQARMSGVKPEGETVNEDAR